MLRTGTTNPGSDEQLSRVDISTLDDRVVEVGSIIVKSFGVTLIGLPNNPQVVRSVHSPSPKLSNISLIYIGSLSCFVIVAIFVLSFPFLDSYS
jgi:hypothetical protein